MIRRWVPGVLGLALAAGLWAGGPGSASAQVPGQVPPQTPPLPRFDYYPYYYFPHNYWPAMSPQWPEPPGSPYTKPPAYMAYPPFREPNWRYEMWQPQKYYRGNHFWLDIF